MSAAAAIRDYYAAPSPFTAPGRHAAALQALPRDTDPLVEIVQGLALHQYFAGAYGHEIPASRLGEAHLRDVAAILDRIVALDPAPLSVARPVDRRVVGVCRHHVLLLVAMLRAKGIPARARVGFGLYFNPGCGEDHWVCEWWDEAAGRWKLADPQFDAVWRNALNIGHDILDVPRDRFLTAAEAWERCRTGAADPTTFGIFQGNLRGLWFVAGNLVRDLAALNKVEMLPWDSWGAMPGPNAAIGRAELAFFDNLAALTREPDVSFATLRRFYDGDARLRVPAMVFNAVRQQVEPVPLAA
jgi:hypothetical protein